jgi:MFS family permease
METARMATSTKKHGERRSTRALRRDEKRLLAVLGLPTFGLALAITLVSTYVSKIAHGLTSSTIEIGVIVGAEGFVALFVPLIAGTWSDQLRSRYGGRLPFLFAGTPVVAAGLVLIGFVHSLLALALVVLLFFFAYFVAYEPYRALYPDLIDDEVEGRAQSTQALWRGAGTGLALLGGGLLLSLGRPVPFIGAAFVLVAAVLVFTAGLRRTGVRYQRAGARASLRDNARHLRALVAEHPALRAFLLANGLWELTLGALKSFIILYITVGLGRKLTVASIAVGVVALIILASTPVSGKLADRFGRMRTMRIALFVYGLGLLVPLFTPTIPIVIAAVPFVAFGGGVLMTLPYALLAPMMPDSEHGALTGFYSLSRGIGTMLGPILAGVAIEVFKSPLASTHGYAAMWGVCSVSALASIPLLSKIREHERDRHALSRS